MWPFPPYVCLVDINKAVIAPSLMKHVSTRPAQPGVQPSPVYDPYAGMKTPGQRQLISLQERVKVGEITVDEAVQEFKAWQFDHKQRAYSIRYQHVWIGHIIYTLPLVNTRQGGGLFTNVIDVCFLLRKTWSGWGRASPGVTKRGKRQGRSWVGSLKIFVTCLQKGGSNAALTDALSVLTRC